MRSNEHDEFATLVPWYVNGTLDEHDMERMSAHLETCKVCTRDVAETLTHARTLHDVPTPELDALNAGRDRNYARLARRLERECKPTHRRTAIAQGAVVALVVVAAFGFWLWPATNPTDAVFEAMTSPAVEAADGQVLQVIFDPDTSEVEVRRLLLDVGTLLGSPSASGVYRVALGARADAAGYAARLREHPAVRWAEVERR